MKDRALLAGYLIAVVGITFIHDPIWLAALLTVALVLAGREAPVIARRAMLAVLLVNIAVSLGYVLMASLDGHPWALFVLRLNLRVYLLTFLALWLARHLDLVAAVAFSPSLKFLIAVVLSQLQGLRRMARDFQHAFASRTPARPTLLDRYRGAGRAGRALMDKAETQATELNQGLTARGFFDDRA